MAAQVTVKSSPAAKVWAEILGCKRLLLPFAIHVCDYWFCIFFARRDFPWVGNWEESCSRVHVPWNGREFCRGFEFSTTPFPIPRRATVTNREVFGESTYKMVARKKNLNHQVHGTHA